MIRSMSMLVLTLASAIRYEVYAALLGLWPVLVMNGIFGLLVIVEIARKARFDRGERAHCSRVSEGRSPNMAR